MGAIRPSNMLSIRKPTFSSTNAIHQRSYCRPSRIIAQATITRRSFGGLVASFLATSFTKEAFAVTPVDLKDDRKAKSTGFDLIYEARDLDLPQNVRDGMTQARGSLDDTKKRIVQEALPYVKSLLGRGKRIAKATGWYAPF